jgi:hypothetical protein
VKGLAINGFAWSGIALFTGNQDAVTGCFLGTDPLGTTRKPNSSTGILVESGGNTIGGTAAGARNLISGNGWAGVHIAGSGAANNLVEGDSIGTDLTGTKALANSSYGIIVSGGAAGNTIGGTSAGARNLISGNGWAAVQISDAGTANNLVEGNTIGTDLTGARALPNGTLGVYLSGGASANTVGGPTAAARNLISGNGWAGLDIWGAGTTKNLVEGNYLGTDLTGAHALANTSFGILVIGGAANNTIGGTAAGDLNLISANGYAGVQVSDAGTTKNLVEGNYLGTDVTGTRALPNGTLGAYLGAGAAANTIGGATAAARNVISANGWAGLQVADPGTANNVVEGNYIGTDVSGARTLANGTYGITITNGPTANTIGGTVAGAGNVVSGNPFCNIGLGNANTTDHPVTSNVVVGNDIGTDFTGKNALANTGPGVLLGINAQSNQIGGSPAFPNVIAFNTVGVVVRDATATGNSIRANSIFGNQNLGIDLGWDGVTPNHLKNADTGPNHLQNYPIIKTASPGSPTAVSGSFNSLPSTTFTLDFYANPTRDPGFFGEGQTYLGSAPVTTDANGNASFAVTLPAATTAGEWVAATATDPAGNTSEFSAAFPLPGNQTLNPVSWQSIGPSPILWGPNTGRIPALAPDPTNANVMYAGGENGGVWKTTDWQDPSPHWVPLTDNQPSLAIGPHTLAVAKSNPSTIYAAAGAPNGGILKSTDGGTTWSFLGSSVFANHTFGALAVDPTNANVVYVAVNTWPTGGVYKSTDGGQTWKLTTAAVGGTATDLVLDVNQPSTLYAGFTAAAAGSNGIWKTTDGGTTWKPSSSGIADLPSWGYIRLAQSPSNSSDVYATVLDSNNPNGIKRYRSTSGAAGWTAMTDLPTSEGWRIVLGVDPGNPLVVYANGDHNLYKSTDGGTTWNKLLDCDPQGVYFDDSGAMTLGHDNGIYRFPAGTTPYAIKTGDLAVSEFSNIALDPTNPNAAYGVAIDFPGALKYGGSAVWTYQVTGGVETEFGTMLVDPAQPNTVYYYASDNYPNTYNFLRSDDGGFTFNPQTTGLNTTEANSQTALAEDPANPARLLLGTTVVYETKNRGGQWTALPSSPAQSGGVYLTHLAIGNHGTIYASTSDGRLFTSGNDGTTWVEADHGLPATGVSAIQVDPANDQEAVITLGGSTSGGAGGSDVWMTTTGGGAWSRLTGDLPNYATNTLAVDWRFATPVLYVGTTRGVYASTNLGGHWATFGQSLPNTVVDQLVLVPGLDVLAAGTYGRGAFEIQVPGPATHLALSAPAAATAGSSFGITVTAFDASNVVASAYTGTVRFTSTDTQAVLPANYTFTAADHGRHTFTVTLKTAGSQTLTATDTATASVKGSQAVTVNPAAAGKLKVTGFPTGIQVTAPTVARSVRRPKGWLDHVLSRLRRNAQPAALVDAPE